MRYWNEKNGMDTLCGNKTRNQIRDDTVLLNFPLYCPKCKQETLIEAKYLKVTVIDNRDKLNIV